MENIVDIFGPFRCLIDCAFGAGAVQVDHCRRRKNPSD